MRKINVKKSMRAKITEVSEIPRSPRNGEIFLIQAKGISDHSHGIFKYPCKFIPHVPRWFLESYGTASTSKYGVLDPFMGSGTTLVEASLLGYPSYGVDIDPLSKLLSKVKTTSLSDDEFAIIDGFIDDYHTSIKKRHKYKKEIIELMPDKKLVGYWFSEKAINDLSYLRFLIKQNYTNFKNRKVKEFLDIVLVSTIRKTSKADNQSPKPYISKRIKKTPVLAHDEFYKNLVKYTKALKKFSKESKAKANIIGFDARNIDRKSIAYNKVSLAMTSPPYINAFDYVRSLKLENFWLDGFDSKKLSELYDLQIGTEKIKASSEAPKYGIEELDLILNKIHSVDKKRAWITHAYFKAMEENLKSVFGCLKKGGYYCVVVGNSTIRGFSVDTSDMISQIAQKVGYSKELEFSYVIRNRYLRIPRLGRGGFIPKDHVLVFKK